MTNHDAHSIGHPEHDRTRHLDKRERDAYTDPSRPRVYDTNRNALREGYEPKRLPQSSRRCVQGRCACCPFSTPHLQWMQAASARPIGGEVCGLSARGTLRVPRHADLRRHACLRRLLAAVHHPPRGLSHPRGSRPVEGFPRGRGRLLGQRVGAHGREPHQPRRQDWRSRRCRGRRRRRHCRRSRPRRPSGWSGVSGPHGPGQVRGRRGGR